MTGIKKLQKATRFDMKRKPIRQRNYLRPVTWILSFPDVWMHHLKVNKTRMEGVKPPFLLLCTHHAFIDFKVTTAALFPYRANYVVAIDGFLKREWLLRNAGGICKRKFTNDLQLIRQIREVLITNQDILALYPEARYSLVGTTAVLPDSLGKMAKLLGVPVVMLNMHGHYLNSPVWIRKSWESHWNRYEPSLYKESLQRLLPHPSMLPSARLLYMMSIAGKQKTRSASIPKPVLKVYTNHCINVPTAIPNTRCTARERA